VPVSHTAGDATTSSPTGTGADASLGGGQAMSPSMVVSDVRSRGQSRRSRPVILRPNPECSRTMRPITPATPIAESASQDDTARNTNA